MSVLLFSGVYQDMEIVSPYDCCQIVIKCALVRPVKKPINFENFGDPFNCVFYFQTFSKYRRCQIVGGNFPTATKGRKSISPPPPPLFTCLFVLWRPFFVTDTPKAPLIFSATAIVARFPQKKSRREDREKMKCCQNMGKHGQS